jgi:hypothetical protein
VQRGGEVEHRTIQRRITEIDVMKVCGFIVSDLNGVVKEIDFALNLTADSRVRD